MNHSPNDSPPRKPANTSTASASNWTRTRKCITCHTNMPYLTARPLLPGDEGGRKCARSSRRTWSRGRAGGKPRGDAYVVATAFALAFNDAQQTGKLHADDAGRARPDVRRADARPASGTGSSATGRRSNTTTTTARRSRRSRSASPRTTTRKTDKAKAGIEKLKAYFAKTPPPDLHHTAMLLWASTKLAGLMTAEEQKKAIAALRAKQQQGRRVVRCRRSGEYKRRDDAKTPNDPHAPSDGYGTGFVTYVLLQAGVKPDDPAIAKRA